MKLSILGLYNYRPDIFDSIRLPKSLDKQVFVNNLLMECAELEILYPDYSFCKFAFGVWSEKMIDQWEHFEETMYYEYDPISNYDRTDTRNVSRETKSISAGKTNSSSDSVDKVSAFDTGDFANSSSNINNNTSNSEGSASGNETEVERVNSKGNIGVTTTQQMIEAERNIIANLYDRIITDFKYRFCLTLY